MISYSLIPSTFVAYQEILKIPTGAMHIQIQEAYESLNYLGM